jgi:hypothetical protein
MTVTVKLQLEPASEMQMTVVVPTVNGSGPSILQMTVPHELSNTGDGTGMPDEHFSGSANTVTSSGHENSCDSNAPMSTVRLNMRAEPR